MLKSKFRKSPQFCAYWHIDSICQVSWESEKTCRRSSDLKKSLTTRPHQSPIILHCEAKNRPFYFSNNCQNASHFYNFGTQILEWTCNKTATKLPTSPDGCSHPTLWNETYMWPLNRPDLNSADCRIWKYGQSFRNAFIRNSKGRQTPSMCCGY